MHPNGWSFAPERMQEILADDRIKFGVDESTRPTLKVYLDEANKEAAYSVFYQDGRGASKRLGQLMGGAVFDFPKDENVIESLVEMVTSNDELVLDFFAGSATTAHSVMALNAKDGGSRRFVQVQLPEPTPEKSLARTEGYRTIAEISRERIRRAGAAIAMENKERLARRETPLDFGFRAYALGETNFSKWKVSSDVDRNQLEQHLFELQESSSAENASADDLLSEILLKQGYSLTEQIVPIDVVGLNLRSVGDGIVLAYLNEHVKPTLDQLRAVVDEDPARLIVLEDAFQGDDQLKTNLAQLCKSNGIELWTA